MASILRPELVPLVGVALSLLGAAYLVRVIVSGWGILGYDAWAYYTVDLGHLYRFDGVVNETGAFRYSPVVAQLLDPLGALSWPAFFALWTAMLLGTLLVVGRYALALLLLPPIVADVYFGNLDILLGVALGLAARYPALLALPLLTKVTPGVGILWFAARRDWRALGLAFAAAALVASVSLVTTPALWADWIRSLSVLAPTSYGSGPLPPRMVVALALVAWGGATNRAWTIVVAGWLAVPGLDWKTSAILVGLPLALKQPRHADRFVRPR